MELDEKFMSKVKHDKLKVNESETQMEEKESSSLN